LKRHSRILKQFRVFYILDSLHVPNTAPTKEAEQLSDILFKHFNGHGDTHVGCAFGDVGHLESPNSIIHPKISGASPTQYH